MNKKITIGAKAGVIAGIISGTLCLAWVVVGCAAVVGQSKIPQIGFPNEVYYSIDTESRRAEWHDVKSGRKGKGLLGRET